MAADNVIDELKVVVSLDPAKFEEGRKKVGASFDDTKTRARKTAEELESAGKQGGEFFDVLASKALRLGVIFMGGVGLKDFIQNSISGGSAAGYMAKNIGISAQELTRWRTIVREVGGNADQVGPALLGLSQALTQVQLNGKANPELVQAFQYLGIYGAQLIDQTTGRLRTLGELLPEIQKGLAALARQQGVPFAVAIGGKIGVPQDLLNAFVSPDYQKFSDQADRVSRLTERQRQDLQKLTSVWGLYSSALETTGRELGADVAEGFETAAPAINKVVHALESIDRNALRDLGELLGGLAGMFAGMAAGTLVAPGIGTLVGGIVGILGGTLGGGVLGSAAKRTNDAINPAAPAAPAAPATSRSIWESLKDTVRNSLSAPGNQLPSFGSKPAPAPAAPAAAPAPTADVQDFALAAAAFKIIQQLEGGQAGTVTPTGRAGDPYAYGKNQITLGTAQRFDKGATAARLLDPAYNDALARKIQASYLDRYHGDLDAVAIAYHNGPDAADRFVQSGGSTGGISNFGAKSQRYLDRERALAAQSGITNNSSTTHIGSISVNAPKATDAAGVAAEIRKELSDNALVSQANTVGPQ